MDIIGIFFQDGLASSMWSACRRVAVMIIGVFFQDGLTGMQVVYGSAHLLPLHAPRACGASTLPFLGSSSGQ